MKNATRGREAHTRNSCGLTDNYSTLCRKQSHRDQSRAFKLHRQEWPGGRCAQLKKKRQKKNHYGSINFPLAALPRAALTIDKSPSAAAPLMGRRLMRSLGAALSLLFSAHAASAGGMAGRISSRRRSRVDRPHRLAISVQLPPRFRNHWLRIFHRTTFLFRSLRQRLSILLLLGSLVRLLPPRPRLLRLELRCHPWATRHNCSRARGMDRVDFRPLAASP
jgi:hypothetical protein